MNNRGQEGKIGLFLMLGIALIVSLTIFDAIGEPVGELTNTFTRVNHTVTTAAVNSTVELTGKALVGTPTIINSSGTVVNPANFTFVSQVGSDNVKSLFIRSIDAGAPFASQSINITYTYQGDGYVEESGGRSVASLIPLLAALALIVGVAVVGYRMWQDN